MSGVELSIIEYLLSEIIGPAAFPTAACALLWFKLQRSDETRAKEVQEYLSVIKESSRVIGENTSALNRMDR